MRHVQVAAEDDRLFGVQLLQIAAQVVLPLHTVVNARQLVLGVGHVEIDQIKIRVFQRDGAALVVVNVLVEAIAHRQRRRFGPDGRAGVALFVGAVDVLGVARGRKIRLSGLHFGLLNAEEVRVQRVEHVLKAFFQAGAQTVDVPADEFHGWYSFMYDYPRVFCQPRSRGRTCAARHLPANERLWEKPRAGHARPLPLGKVFLRCLLHRVLFPATADEPGHKA